MVQWNKVAQLNFPTFRNTREISFEMETRQSSFYRPGDLHGREESNGLVFVPGRLMWDVFRLGSVK